MLKFHYAKLNASTIYAFPSPKPLLPRERASYFRVAPSGPLLHPPIPDAPRRVLFLMAEREHVRAAGRQDLRRICPPFDRLRANGIPPHPTLSLQGRGTDSKSLHLARLLPDAFRQLLGIPLLLRIPLCAAL